MGCLFFSPEGENKSFIICLLAQSARAHNACKIRRVTGGQKTSRRCAAPSVGGIQVEVKRWQRRQTCRVVEARRCPESPLGRRV